MQFALLVSQLPRVDEARAHYNELLALQPRQRAAAHPHVPAAAAASLLGALRAALHAWHR